MGDGGSRKYGFLQDLFFLVVTVSFLQLHVAVFPEFY